MQTIKLVSSSTLYSINLGFYVRIREQVVSGCIINCCHFLHLNKNSEVSESSLISAAT